MSLPDYLRAEAPQAVFAALPDSRAVGGCVRDSLAGLDVRDLDMAAPFPPEAIAGRLKAAGFKVFETGLSHGTVTAVLGGVPIEVTSLRRDVTTDGRHAEVEWTTDWREDAERRDFTINAMSMGADGVLHDYYDGAADLAGRRVRFVGDAAQRLREDYLRALRFFRFHARYGGPEPDPVAVRAIREAVPGLARLSAERVWSELKRLMEAEDPREALRLMIATGVWGAVLPEADIALLPAFEHLVEIGAPTDPVLRLAAFAPFSGRLLNGQRWATVVSERLRMSRTEEKVAGLFENMALSVLSKQAFVLPKNSDSRICRLLLYQVSQLGGDTHRLADAIMWLREARSVLDEFREWRDIDYRAVREMLAETPVPVFPLQGRDALDLGVQPGPSLGSLLSETKQWWLAEGAVADHAACLEKLRELVARGAS